MYMYRDLNGIHIAIILCSLFAIITVTNHMYRKRQLLLSQLNIYRITFKKKERNRDGERWK